MNFKKHKRLNYLAFSLICGALAFVACSDKSANPEPTPSLSFTDYAFIDTAGVALVRYVPPASQNIQLVGEMVMDWEKSFGEPFTDTDSDGVYTAGADGFVICNCPDNQDLNHNSKYDSPDPADWSPGVPFDDINADGALNIENYSYYNGYQPGRPYADINGNGRHDAMLSYNYRLLRPELRPVGPGEALLTFSELDPAPGYYFISDSGVTYELPSGTHRLPNFELLFDEDGVSKVLFAGLTVQILPPGSFPTNVSDVVTVGDPAAPATIYQRTVTSGQTLQTPDTTYNSLILVSLTAPNPPRSGGASFHEYFVYFSRDIGVLAARCELPGGESESWYFDKRYSSVPLPMTR